MRLTDHEMRSAAMVGLERQLESIRKGRTPNFKEQYPNQMFTNHIVGAMAEMVVAKELGIHWGHHVNLFGKPDLNLLHLGIEVRYSPHRRDVKVKKKDAEETMVVGVTGEPPEFEILGLCRAGQARELVKPTSPAKGVPAYFVPEHLLRGIDELKQWHMERLGKLHEAYLATGGSDADSK